MNTSNPPFNKDDYLSTNQIAHRIKRSRPSVADTIERLELKPSFTLSNIRYYHRDCISPIQTAMRKPNGHSSGQTKNN